jgi:hypothetical protein
MVRSHSWRLAETRTLDRGRTVGLGSGPGQCKVDSALPLDQSQSRLKEGRIPGQLECRAAG